MTSEFYLCKKTDERCAFYIKDKINFFSQDLLATMKESNSNSNNDDDKDNRRRKGIKYKA